MQFNIASGSLLGLIFAALASSSLPAQNAPIDAAARQRREYSDFATMHNGDALRGRVVFENEQRAACVKCHSVNGGSKAGPDLSSIGDKFPRSELIRSVLEPSAQIAVGYGTTVVETKTGEQFEGVLKGSSTDAIDLMGGDGRPVHIARRDIKEQHEIARSLMPEGLQSGLTREEFADLIEYLFTLKQPTSALANNRGMPENISELAKPVTVRPFIPESLSFPHAFVEKPGDVRYGLVWFGQLPGVKNNFLAVEQNGKVWRLQKNGDSFDKKLFLDLSADVFYLRGPNGLLGLAFHPNFSRNHRYFLKHQVLENNQVVTTVVERQAVPDSLTDSGQPSKRLWQVTQTTQDHSGGCIAFGPDGFLYIGMGDSGPQNDPQGHGQDLTTTLGKMLRIDVDHASAGLPYSIPADNPFRNRPGACPEIWAYGFREPWRFSFDSVTGDLWVGDVGQDRVEEIDLVRRGENLGWNAYEGFEPFSNQYRKADATYTPPVFAYRRKFGNSVTGGGVYRGDKHSSFFGVYIFADYTSHRIFGLKEEGRKLQVIRQIGTTPQGIVCFAADDNGEMYAVGYEGMIYHLDFTASNFNDNKPGVQTTTGILPARND